MRNWLLSTLLFLCAAPLLAQAPAPASAPAAVAAKAHANDIGFSYNLPSDWEVVDIQSEVPAIKDKVEKEATSEGEKIGASCTQIALTGRHGDPASVVVVISLTFTCVGQEFTAKDLPAFGTGVSEGLKSTFEISDSIQGDYSLGSHRLWIERATGKVKTAPGSSYTVETVCSLLKKGAVCWLVMAADNSSLQTIEHGAVSLEGEAAPGLVPVNAFDKKPPEK
jgi:hypothetical protein